MTFKPKCGKFVYRDRAEAKKALKELNKQGPNISKKLTDVYYCEFCSAYHLTSMNKKKSRYLKRSSH
jgi:ribosomal protein L20